MVSKDIIVLFLVSHNIKEENKKKQEWTKRDNLQKQHLSLKLCPAKNVEKNISFTNFSMSFCVSFCLPLTSFVCVLSLLVCTTKKIIPGNNSMES